MSRRKHSYRRGRKCGIKNLVIACLVMTFLFTIGYSAFQTVISINAKGNIKEKSRVIRSWTYNSVDDFHNAQYRENIVSVTFLDSTALPSDVDKSWDVSADGKGGVIAYVTINEDDYTKYDLFIGAKDGVIANENSSYLFYNFTNVEAIEFNNNFDTSNVTNMYGVFLNCYNLKTLDLKNFNTSKVTTMRDMFAGCHKMSEIDLSSFNTINVTDMWGIFNGCQNLIQLDLSNFNTSNVKNMGTMFISCSSLITLDLSGFDTSSVENMSRMFDRCTSLVELNLSSFNTGVVKNMDYMFLWDSNLKTIYVSDTFITENVIETSNMPMFDGTRNLIGGNGTTYDSNHIDKEYARIDKEGQKGYFTLKK